MREYNVHVLFSTEFTHTVLASVLASTESNHSGLASVLAFSRVYASVCVLASDLDSLGSFSVFHAIP